jgi:hypothetical protein
MWIARSESGDFSSRYTAPPTQQPRGFADSK